MRSRNYLGIRCLNGSLNGVHGNRFSLFIMGSMQSPVSFYVRVLPCSTNKPYRDFSNSISSLKPSTICFLVSPSGRGSGFRAQPP